jgi:hypothetical protein
VLKPAGVRFGSAEIYNILTRFFSADVDDAVCVGRRRATDLDETVCLFVVLKSAAGGGGSNRVLDDALREQIRAVVRRELSPRHVPAVIEQCGPAGIPKTGNGKKYVSLLVCLLSYPCPLFAPGSRRGGPRCTDCLLLFFPVAAGSKSLSSRFSLECKSKRMQVSLTRRPWTGFESGPRRSLSQVDRGQKLGGGSLTSSPP